MGSDSALKCPSLEQLWCIMLTDIQSCDDQVLLTIKHKPCSASSSGFCAHLPCQTAKQCEQNKMVVLISSLQAGVQVEVKTKCAPCIHPKQDSLT